VKTIRMPKKLLAKWLKALRSGGYTQAKGTMYDTETMGFCCLGVLQHTTCGGYVEFDPEWNTYEGYPTRDWKTKRGVEFRNEFGSSLGGSCLTPWLPALSINAADANDSGKTFAEIADAIEACAEGY